MWVCCNISARIPFYNKIFHDRCDFFDFWLRNYLSNTLKLCFLGDHFTVAAYYNVFCYFCCYRVNLWMSQRRFGMAIIYCVLYFLIIVVPILISVAYLTLLERKILGYSQIRKGPNVVGLYGVLQPLADGVKLFSKEIIIPSHANLFLFSFAPILALLMGLVPWFIFPWGGYSNGLMLDHSFSLLILLAILSVGIFGVLLSGWSSSSKYAFLGSIRAVAQMISYEVSLSIILMGIIITIGSINLAYIYLMQEQVSPLLFSLWPLAFIYLVSMLAETNRAPFDLSEGESELVSGYNVEYSSMPFALFFLAEYSHIIFSSFIFAILFMGANQFNWWGGVILKNIFAAFGLCIKGTIICFCFLWVRTSFPRIRYDQLMGLLWKNYLPVSIALLWLINGILVGFNLGISSSLN